MPDMTRLIRAARGQEAADLLIRQARVVDVFSGTIALRDVAVADGAVVGFGPHEAREVVDADGAYLVPGLIDAHAHIESSMLAPARFAECVLPHGTTTIAADPHEIANVCGGRGIEYFLACAEKLPLNMAICLPSCVPAAPFEDAGAVMDADALRAYMGDPHVAAVGEMMNFPGVISADAETLARVSLGREFGKPVNGHAPGLLGADLDAYTVAGIADTHEASTVEEMNAVIARGGYVFLRQGSAARDLMNLLPGLTPANARRCAFCSDDKHTDDILTNGHMDASVVMAIAAGIDPVQAVTMATLNAAEALGLKRKGGIAPGWDADLLLVGDLKKFDIRKVWAAGRLVAENGRIVVAMPHIDATGVVGAMNVAPLSAGDFELRVPSGQARVIQVVPGSIVTGASVRTVAVDRQGRVNFQANPGLNLIAVVERHKGTGRIGLGLVEGFSIQGGALATSVAHDSHNIIAVGDSAEAILLAVRKIVEMGGGEAVVHAGAVVDSLALPIAGLMTDADPADVSTSVSALIRTAHATLGVPSELEPFMALSFMALPVIPHLKLTARGLFDVDTFAFTSVDAGA